MALAVVMLLTFFMSEFFFATGLELRGMTTFKDSERARMLARAAFKTVQVGLMDDEVLFFKGYRELTSALQFAALPWNDGLLLTLEVAPQDHLYNVNENFNQQPGQDSENGRRSLFVATLADVEVAQTTPGTQPLPLEGADIDALYAAIFDWIDSDGEDYVNIPGVLGGEQHAYFTRVPEVRVKNGALDRLEELRVINGLAESKVPWGIWEQRFTALPKSTDSRFYFTEKINVNVASAAEIQRFLEDRRMDILPSGSNFRSIQSGVNAYADKAQEIAEALVPAEGTREIYTMAEVEEILRGLGYSDRYGVNHLLSTINEHYRIRIVTEVAGVRARLEAMIHVRRDRESRLGTPPVVEWITLQ